MAKKRKQTQNKKVKEGNTFDKKTWMYAIFLAASAFLLYANTLGHEYALDDYSAIKDNYVTQQGIEGISTIFTTHYRHGYWNSPGELYRPLTLAMFALEWEILPDSPSFYHFMNVLFYALTGMLLFFTLRRLFKEYSLLLPFFATLLFLAHPVHVEVVANIKSRDEILAFLFSIGALNLLWKYWDSDNIKWLVLSLITYLFAMFSKENAITFLAIFPLTYWFFQRKFSWAKISQTAFYIIPVGIYLMARKSVLGTLSSGKVPSVLDNVLISADGFGEQLATAILFLGKYFTTLFLPYSLSHELGYIEVPLTGFGDWRVILILLFIFGMLFYAIWNLFKNKNPIAFGILFFVINFSIFSNILIIIGTNYGDRLLYASSLGFTLILTFLILKIFDKILRNHDAEQGFLTGSSIQVIAVFTGIVVLYSFKTITRNSVWKDSFMLYQSDIETNPKSAKLNYHYGLELSKRADKSTTNADKKKYYELGMKHLLKAIEIYPKYHDAYSRMGLTYYEGKDFQNALKNYELAIKYKPNNASVLSNMGTLYFEQKNIPKAIESYQKAVNVDPRFVDGWRNLGSLNAQLKNFEEAIRCFSEGLKYAQNDATLNYYLGSAYLDSGQEALGRPFLNKSYELNPALPKK